MTPACTGRVRRASRRCIRHLGPAVLAAGLLASPALASRRVTLEPTPWPEARSFVITEFGMAYRLNAFPAVDDDGADPSPSNRPPPRASPPLQRRQLYSSRLGLAINLSRRYAVGLGHLLAMDEGGENRGGPSVTVRRWLSGRSTIDLSLAYFLWDTRHTSRHPVFQGSLAYATTDWLAFEVQYEYGSFRGYTDNALYAGVKTASGPGLLLNGVAAAAAVIVGISVLIIGTD